MKITFKISLIFLFAIVLYSCTDDSLNLKNSILPTKDEITLATDTFHIKAADSLVDATPARISTDTFLIGSYTDATYGTTTARMLAQFNCPVGWTVPSTITGDTLKLVLTYTGYQATGDSTLNVKVYRTNTSLNYSTTYYSNTAVDSTTEVGSISYKPSSSSGSGSISIVLDTALKNEFIAAARNNNSVYASETAFTDFFKGLYISVDGSSTAMFTLSYIQMAMQYNYTNSGGTVISQVEEFPANKEVRQVNLIKHSGTQPSQAGILYVSSPAGREANVNIPISRIRDSLHIKVINGTAYLNSTTRRLSVNSAMLTFEVSDSSTIDYPTYLLLIKKSSVASFFKTSTVPDGKTAVLAVYSSSKKTYTFSLKSYLANELKDASVTGDDPMVLIPVMVTYDSSDDVTGVIYDSKLHAVALKGSTNSSPLRLNLVVSGF